MSELTLISTSKRPLRPLIQAALENELRLVEAGMRRSEQRLQEFEARYNLDTQIFIQQFERDALEETLDFDEWIAEHRLLIRLSEKADALRGVEFAS